MKWKNERNVLIREENILLIKTPKERASTVEINKYMEWKKKVHESVEKQLNIRIMVNVHVDVIREKIVGTWFKGSVCVFK